MISPGAEGLFHKAVPLSSGGIYSDAVMPFSDALKLGERVADEVGCSDQSAKCLRNVPVKTLLRQTTKFSAANVVVDGVTMPMTVPQALKSGEFHRVPTIAGSARNDYRWFQALEELDTGHILKPSEYPSASWRLTAKRLVAMSWTSILLRDMDLLERPWPQ